MLVHAIVTAGRSISFIPSILYCLSSPRTQFVCRNVVKSVGRPNPLFFSVGKCVMHFAFDAHDRGPPKVDPKVFIRNVCYLV